LALFAAGVTGGVVGVVGVVVGGAAGELVGTFTGVVGVLPVGVVGVVVLPVPVGAVADAVALDPLPPHALNNNVIAKAGATKRTEL
jgi:hypothetical protein